MAFKGEEVVKAGISIQQQRQVYEQSRGLRVHDMLVAVSAKCRQERV